MIRLKKTDMKLLTTNEHQEAGLQPTAVPGKVVGPSFSASEVPEVIEAVLETYRQQRQAGETFIATLRRVGMEPYKDAAKAARLPAAV